MRYRKLDLLADQHGGTATTMTPHRVALATRIRGNLLPVKPVTKMLGQEVKARDHKAFLESGKSARCFHLEKMRFLPVELYAIKTKRTRNLAEGEAVGRRDASWHPAGAKKSRAEKAVHTRQR